MTVVPRIVRVLWLLICVRTPKDHTVFAVRQPDPARIVLNSQQG
jgi:hypothetical protein